MPEVLFFTRQNDLVERVTSLEVPLTSIETEWSRFWVSLSQTAGKWVFFVISVEQVRNTRDDFYAVVK